MRVLVLGATGMLGHILLHVLSGDKRLDVFGTIRDDSAREFFPGLPDERLISGVGATDHDSLTNVLAEIAPAVVINCIGVVKQLPSAKDPLHILPLNSLLPHRLVALCKLADARLIHISTDCVFSGAKGDYKEEDVPDACDLYGRSKWMGEVDAPHALTLRTSIIGPELGGNRNGLVGWFLGEQGMVKGYKRAIFSGLPTVELSRVIRDHILPHSDLRGVYHVAASPIDKYSLLCLIAKIYGKDIEIVSDDTLAIDRSLNAARFHAATGYVAPEWPDLIEKMHGFSAAQKG